MSGSRRVVGQRLARIDASGKVTGGACYGVDQTLPGMLHGALARSSQAHARIVGIDLDAARAMPGVRAIVTAADVPARRYGSYVKDMEVFASDKVVHVGQPIVGIAADTLDQARRAAAAVRVTYAPLPPVLDVEAALAPDAVLVHDHWPDYVALPVLSRDGNVSNRSRLVCGDIEAGFAAAARVFENRFVTSPVHPGYTEPRAALARWDERDELTVWSNTQLPFEAQGTLADIFMTRPSRIRVIGTTIGGGFGGKLRLGTEHYAAVLARKSRRPVKVVNSGEEEITTGYCRQPVVITMKTGVAADGTIVAHQARIIVDTGATSGSGVGVASSAALIATGPYRLPNVSIEGLAVYTNRAPTGSFRAPAGPQANFALESQIDIIATALAIDPVELRMRNALRDGDRAANGQLISGISLQECLRRATDAIGWAARSRLPAGEGIGIACGWWGTTAGSSGVYVKLEPDGQVVLSTGCAEIGTGALTGACQVLAEALAIDLDDIRVVSGDTTSTPFDHGAQGSRSAFAVGNACLDAARDIRRQAIEIAAARLQVPADTLTLADKCVTDGTTSLALADVAALSRSGAGGLIARGTFLAPATPWEKTRTMGMVINVLNSPSFHVHAAHVRVDNATGEVRVLDYVAVQDVGFAINPTYVEGQIEGGVVQGIGQALSEEVVTREGRVLNPNLTDYKMPTAVDVPRIRTVLVESPSAVGPFGAKGVGEPPVIEPPAAIANAIAAASGKRLKALPMTAERVHAG